MEVGTFLQPAVAEKLNKDYIEARLHLDGQDRLAPEVDARNQELRKRYSDSFAMPTFVVVDPDSLESLGRIRGSMSSTAFLDFLAEAEAKLTRNAANGKGD